MVMCQLPPLPQTPRVVNRWWLGRHDAAGLVVFHIDGADAVRGTPSRRMHERLCACALLQTSARRVRVLVVV